MYILNILYLCMYFTFYSLFRLLGLCVSLLRLEYMKILILVASLYKAFSFKGWKTEKIYWCTLTMMLG